MKLHLHLCSKPFAIKQAGGNGEAAEARGLTTVKLPSTWRRKLLGIISYRAVLKSWDNLTDGAIREEKVKRSLPN